MKSRFPLPTVEDRRGATQCAQMRRTTGDRVDVARRHGHVVVGGGALGQDLELRAVARASRPTHGQDDVSGAVQGDLAGAGHIGVKPDRAVRRGRGPTVAGELVDVARGDAKCVGVAGEEGARLRREDPCTAGVGTGFVIREVDVVRTVDEGLGVVEVLRRRRVTVTATGTLDPRRSRCCPPRSRRSPQKTGPGCSGRKG